MPDPFLAVCLWLGAWLAVSVAVTAGWAAGVKWRSPVLAGAAGVAGLFAAAVLANAGADLW